MKLNKQLLINGEQYPLVKEQVNLNLLIPGRAFFDVISSEALSGVVTFSLDYSLSLKPWFIGFIESSTTVNDKLQRIFCRELTAVLYFQLPLALRQVTLFQVLQAITTKTKLKFSVPDALYSNITTPVFYSVANGYYAMEQLQKTFGIDRLIWQQRTDGTVYVGSWDDSQWPSAKIDMLRNHETQASIANGAKIPALPALRPGLVYNGQILNYVEQSANHMILQWAKNPWHTTL